MNLPPLILKAEATDEVWMQITIDNYPPANVILKAGEKKDWEAVDEFNLWIGNKEGLKMSIDGKPFDLSRYNGKVVKDLVIKREVKKNGK